MIVTLHALFSTVTLLCVIWSACPGLPGSPAKHVLAEAPYAPLGLHGFSRWVRVLRPGRIDPQLLERQQQEQHSSPGDSMADLGVGIGSEKAVGSVKELWV